MCKLIQCLVDLFLDFVHLNFTHHLHLLHHVTIHSFLDNSPTTLSLSLFFHSCQIQQQQESNKPHSVEWFTDFILSRRAMNTALRDYSNVPESVLNALTVSMLECTVSSAGGSTNSNSTTTSTTSSWRTIALTSNGDSSSSHSHLPDKSGVLWKKGQRGLLLLFRERFCCVRDRKLYYYLSQEHFARGDFKGYVELLGATLERMPSMQFGFMITTAQRVWYFKAASQLEMLVRKKM
jgi:hypothetical protein